MKKTQVIVYLHGFNSSNKALKAQLTEQYLQQHHPQLDFLAPSIPDLPDKAADFLDNYIRQLKCQYDDIILIGSSLGGFYATWLSERFFIRAVLVNPAIRPHDLMQHYSGWNENPYSGVRYELTATHMQTLQSLYINNIQHPQNFIILLQMADEVLDAAEASAKFYSSPCRIMPGGDHSFQNFERMLPEICGWAGLFIE